MTMWRHLNNMQFVEYIQQDSDICNNCFRRTHVTYERNFAVDTVDGELWARKIEVSDRSWRLPDETTKAPLGSVTDGESVTCKCGAGQVTTLRPVDTQTAIEYAKRIAKRLDEKGVNHDTDVLLDTVRQKMGESDKQGKQDSEVFGESVQRACKCSRQPG